MILKSSPLKTFNAVTTSCPPGLSVSRGVFSVSDVEFGSQRFSVFWRILQQENSEWMCEAEASNCRAPLQLTLPAADRALSSSVNYALIIYSCFILHQEPFVLPFLSPSTSLCPLTPPLSQGCNGASFPIPPRLVLRHDSLPVMLSPLLNAVD